MLLYSVDWIKAGISYIFLTVDLFRNYVLTECGVYQIHEFFLSRYETGLCWLKYDCLLKVAAQILCNNIGFITILKYLV